MDDRCKRCRAPALTTYLCARCAAALLHKKATVYAPARDCRQVTEPPDDPERQRRIEAMAARAEAKQDLFGEA